MTACRMPAPPTSLPRSYLHVISRARSGVIEGRGRGELSDLGPVLRGFLTIRIGPIAAFELSDALKPFLEIAAPIRSPLRLDILPARDAPFADAVVEHTTIRPPTKAPRLRQLHLSQGAIDRDAVFLGRAAHIGIDGSTELPRGPSAVGLGLDQCENGPLDMPWPSAHLHVLRGGNI